MHQWQDRTMSRKVYTNMQWLGTAITVLIGVLTVQHIVNHLSYHSPNTLITLITVWANIAYFINKTLCGLRWDAVSNNRLIGCSQTQGTDSAMKIIFIITACLVEKHWQLHYIKNILLKRIPFVSLSFAPVFQTLPIIYLNECINTNLGFALQLELLYYITMKTIDIDSVIKLVLPGPEPCLKMLLLQNYTFLHGGK